MTELQGDQPPAGQEVDEDDGPIPVEPGSVSDDLAYVRPDGELERLVILVNATPIGLNVTLTTSGHVVTGELISFDSFMTEVADDMLTWDVNVVDGLEGQENSFGNLTEILSQSFRSAVEVGEASENDDELDFPPRYVHLRGATLYSGGTAFKVKHWRGRMAMVTGWSFGRLSS